MDNPDYSLTTHTTQTTHSLLKPPIEQARERILADFITAQALLIDAMTDKMFSQED